MDILDIFESQKGKEKLTFKGYMLYTKSVYVLLGGNAAAAAKKKITTNVHTF